MCPNIPSTSYRAEFLDYSLVVNLTPLNGNHVKPLNEHRGQLVQGISPDIPGMQPGLATPRFLHILRPRNAKAVRDGLAGQEPGADFRGFHLATELLR